MMNNELIPTPMMSFGESVKTCFQKYVTFKGRARRSEYWWFWLLNLIVSIVTLVLDYKLDMINIEFGIGALADDLAIHQRYHLSAALLLLGTEGEELSQRVGAH